MKKEEATSTSSKAVHQQETKKIQGLVKDIFGEPIIGASVVIKGTTNGTITGLDGEFSLNNVEKGSVIQVSFNWISNSGNSVEWPASDIDSERRFSSIGRGYCCGIWYSKEGKSDRICFSG